jgi:hypothetical protein
MVPLGMRIVVSLLALLITSGAWADGSVAYMLCKNKGKVRHVRIELDADKVCHTLYWKDGAEKSLGTGRNVDSCKKVFENIRTNLAKSNWTCRDIASATVSGG